MEYGAMYSQYRGPMVVTAYRILHDWHMAEDACQEALLILWLKLQAGVVITNHRGYMFRTVANKATDILRRLGKTREHERPYSRPHLLLRPQQKGGDRANRVVFTTVASAENEVVHQTSGTMLAYRIATITTRNPNWIGLLEEKARGFSDSDLAHKRGVTVDVVRQRLRRCRGCVRRELSEAAG